MSFFRDLPIRRKLALISVVTTAVALTLACGAFVSYEQIAFRRMMTRNVSISAQMIAFNSASALSFDDARSAEQTLKALAAQPHIVAACVYDAEGKVFAAYQRAGSGSPHWPAPRGDSHDFSSGSLQLFRKITVEDEAIGTIYLQSDLDEITERWWRYAVIAASLMTAAILAAYMIGRRLQRLISDPISSLAGTIAGVSSGKNSYSVRAVKKGNDELGSLVDGFNDMLSQIEAREGDLQKAHAELETRVEERTRELLVQVAERQRTEEERDRFFTLSLDLLCIANFDGSMRRTNPAFENLLGYTAEDLQLVNYIDLLHSEDRGAMRAEMEKIAGGKTLLDFEVRVHCADGSTRWFAWSCKTAPEGTCFYAYGRDISERKRAESERQDLHRQLLDISRHAGMAEVATSVLHNVGNVLTSVNVSATLVLDAMRNSKTPMVAQVSALLLEHKENLPTFLTNDPRGQQVASFLQTLADALAAERSMVLREVELLQKNVDHINEIVVMQQNYARISGVLETIGVAELVEDAVQMNAGALERHGVALIRDYQNRPSITVEKHKVLQILVNLIRNAKYACTESGRADKRITLRITADHQRVRIAVIDDGIGIPEENLTRIFNHGFTTRPSGHGFGLHSGALIAQELGGAIHVTSEGWHRGAEFIVELPYTAEEKRV
jgi:PAS domain S-box-containing protein